MFEIAILLTGQVRTLKKTILFLQSNFQNTKDQNLSFYCVLEANSNEKQEYESLLCMALQDKIECIIWLDPDDIQLQKVKQNVSTRLNGQLANNWISYLINSGSIVEYYQLYLADQHLKFKESFKKMKYDYIFRIRCDTVFTGSFHYPLTYRYISFPIR